MDALRRRIFGNASAPAAPVVNTPAPAPVAPAPAAAPAPVAPPLPVANAVPAAPVAPVVNTPAPAPVATPWGGVPASGAPVPPAPAPVPAPVAPAPVFNTVVPAPAPAPAPAEPVAFTAPTPEPLPEPMDSAKPRRSRAPRQTGPKPDGTYNQPPLTMSAYIRECILAGQDDDTAYLNARQTFGITDEKNRFGSTLAPSIRRELAKKGLVSMPESKRSSGAASGIARVASLKRWTAVLKEFEENEAKTMEQYVASQVRAFIQKRISMYTS